MATSTGAMRAKRANAVRRRSGADSTVMSSITKPPAQSDAALRWTQSAKADQEEEFGSADECPESEKPDAKPSATANAGQSRTIRPVSQARKTSAMTTTKPSVIATKAVPKRVLTSGERSL